MALAGSSFHSYLAAGITAYLVAQSLLIIGGNLRLLVFDDQLQAVLPQRGVAGDFPGPFDAAEFIGDERDMLARFFERLHQLQDSLRFRHDERCYHQILESHPDTSGEVAAPLQ